MFVHAPHPVTIGGTLVQLTAAAVLSLAGIGAVAAADLPRYRDTPEASPRVYRYQTFADPEPASTSGYYGYYGFDIGGTPYGGLYSENVLCLRSVPTPQGYRTVDVCR